MKKIINMILKYKYIIFLFFIYIILYFQMNNVVFYGDDFEVINPIHNGQDLSSILNFCLNKINYFWNQWSGRIIGHFSVSFILSLGIEVFRFLNPIMIFFMLFLSLKILSLFRKINIKFLLCVFSLIIIGMNIYLSREMLYWAYSSILYIWGFNLTLLVVYFIYKSYKEKTELTINKSIIITFLIIIQSFILEQFSIMLILFLSLIMLFSRKEKINRKKYIIFLIICIISFAISFLAPGNALRTVPLKNELEPYTLAQIVWSKVHLFYKVLFNHKYLGLYFLSFCIIVTNKFQKKEKVKPKKIILSCISYSFFLLFIVNYFIPELNLFGDIYSFDPNSFLDSMIARRDLDNSIIRCIYFTVYMISIIYMFFKVLEKEHRFLFGSYLVTLFVSIIPIILITYCGSRYYIFFLVTIIIILFNFYSEDKKQFIGLKELILILIILPVNDYIKIVIIFITMIIIVITKNKFKNYCTVASIAFIVYSFININLTVYNYNENKKIYDYNENILINHDEYNPIVLYEIPYERSLYSWHSIVLDFNNENRYYGFYINDWCSNYYGINCNQIIVLEDVKNG